VIDTMRFIAGLPVSKAWCATLPRARGADEVDGFATFMMEFNGDFIATCESSFMTKRNLFLELFGENGYARAYDWNENNIKARVETEIDGAFQRYEIENADMYAAEIDAFCACINDEIENPVPGAEGLINQKLIDLVNTGGSYHA
jgi:predicted dehydrogenase